jgi:hypothetical protein
MFKLVEWGNTMISRPFFAIMLLIAVTGAAAGTSVMMIGMFAQQMPVVPAPMGPKPAFELTLLR